MVKCILCFFFSTWLKWDVIFLVLWRAVSNAQYHGASRACGCPHWSVLREKHINIWKRQQLCKERLTRALCLMSSNCSSEELQEHCIYYSHPQGLQPKPSWTIHIIQMLLPWRWSRSQSHWQYSSRSAAAYAETDEQCSFPFRNNRWNLQLIYNTTQTDWSRICGTARSCPFHRWQLQSDHSLLCCHRNTPGS